MLRGRFKDAEEEVREALKRKENQQSLHTDHRALSPLEAEYLAWETAVLDTRKAIYGNVKIQFPYLSPTQARGVDPTAACLPLQVSL